MQWDRKATLFCSVALVASAWTVPATAQQTTEEEARAADEPIVVTGSRVPRKNLESNSPLVSIGSDELKVSAETNLVRELEKQPQLNPVRSPSAGQSSPFTGSFLDLRGLGRERTLVLVNGRRWMNTISDGGVDISTIPPELVERVDIVTGGASATYGSDAVAGVVNFILADSFDGLEFNAQTGMTDRGEWTNARVSLTGGGEFADGKGSGYLHMAYDHSNRLSGKSRDFLNPQVVNADGVLVPNDVPYASSATASIPGGGIGIFTNGGFVDGSGNFTPLPRDRYFNYGPYSVVQPKAQKYQVLGGLSFDVTNNIRLYAEGTYVHEKIAILTGINFRDLGSFDISVNNPFLDAPTRDYVTALDTDLDGLVQIPGLRRRFDEFGPARRGNSRDSFRFMVGAEADLGGGWRLDTSAIYAESNFVASFENLTDTPRLAAALNAVSTPDGPACQVAFVSGQPCVPANIFAEGGLSPAAVNFLRSGGTLRGNNTDYTAQSILTGELFDLPGGPLGIAVGAEFRRNEASENPDDTLRFATGSLPGLAFFSASLEQKELFGEAVIPLVSKASLAHYLGLEIGARFTDFSPGSTAFTYKALAEWAPVENVRFRGGIQRAIRAPNPYELGGGDQAPAELFADVLDSDPCFTGAPLTGNLRDTCIATGMPATIADAGAVLPLTHRFDLTFFGNPSLKPEAADTWTIGAVIEDLPFKGLSFTVDYYKVKIKDAVTYYGAGLTVSNCYGTNSGGANPSCGDITRDPATGRMTALNDGPVNAAGAETRGIDFELAYRTRVPALGADTSLSARFLGNWLIDRTTIPLAQDPDFVRACDGLYGVEACGNPRPRWRSSANVALDTGPVTTSLTWRWLGSVTSDTVVYAPDSVPNLARTSIGARHYFDLNAVWDISRTIQFRAGVENLLDREPPVVGLDQVQPTGPGTPRPNTYMGTYDSVGRRFFVGVRTRF